MFHLALHVLFDFVVASWHAGCLQQCFSTPFSSMFLTLDLFFVLCEPCNIVWAFLD